MDMDELFSQVDEKRKVSRTMLHHSHNHCFRVFVVLQEGSLPKALGSSPSLPALWLAALAEVLRLLTWQQESEKAAALAASCSLVTAHFETSASY